jgi:hypothetical protein
LSNGPDLTKERPGEEGAAAFVIAAAAAALTNDYRLGREE